MTFTLLTIILTALQSKMAMSALLLALWPVAGSIAMKALQAPWAIALLGHGLTVGRRVGSLAAAAPKTGIMKALFAPVVYLTIYAIAFGMAFVDGILGGADPETKKLADGLIQALKKAGANDQILYLEHKTLAPEQSAAVKAMQEAIASGAKPLGQQELATLAQGVTTGNEMQASRLEQ